MFRSTKGASKQRRNLINAEICALRDLLPISDCSRQRLSQLQVMCLTCVYIRKCHCFDSLFSNGVSDYKCVFNFFQAMPGFLMVVTRDGKLLYVSDNVTEHLGHSMVDMVTQGDSVYDIIDKRDHEKVRSNLFPFNPSFPGSGGIDDGQYSADSIPVRQDAVKEDRIFFCRMSIARSCRRPAGPTEHKTINIRGHFVYPVSSEHHSIQPMFVAICCPLVSPDVKDSILHLNTMIFDSVHHLDMRFMEISHNGQFHLGYNEEELVEKSWYELLHPLDLNEAATKHMQLVKSNHEMGCSAILRMQTKSGFWMWMNVFMSLRQSYSCDNDDPAIVCVNHVICESEAVQFKLDNQFLSMYVASSPEYMSQRGANMPQVIHRESTGFYEMDHYETSTGQWAATKNENNFVRDSGVPVCSSTGRGFVTDKAYCVEDFPEYSAEFKGWNVWLGHHS